MFPTLLTIHSLVRWLVLIGLLLAIITSWNGLLIQRPFSKNDNRIRIFTVSIAHVQLVLGLWLYFISPMVDYFLHHFNSAVHERELRFFGIGAYYYDVDRDHIDYYRWCEGEAEAKRCR